MFSSSTASRSLHGFGLLSLFALCSITSSVYRLFENIFHEISFFRFGEIYDLYPVPKHAQHAKLWGGGCRRGSAPRAGQDPGHLAPAAVGQLLGCRCILLAYTVGK